ncbi:7TM diverse intracellular signaling domain-containing protein [Thalassolituus sp.]|uniref:7TM diverse intracellular signaling domain-containing protein n=1 Tax=Thalassolituus sp. TaxID=2030822 RepID=UPI003518FE97
MDFRVSQALALVIMMLCGSFSARAEILVLDSKGSYTTGPYWQYQVVPQTDSDLLPASLSRVMHSQSWYQSTEDSINFGFQRHAYWLKLRLTNQAPGPWFLWNHYSLLDTVVLYQCPSGSISVHECTRSTGGDLRAYSERAIDHPNLILPLGLSTGQSYDLYLYVSTQGAYQLPVEILDQEALQQKLLNNNILRGGYYAMMLIMGLYNLMLFFAIRDRTYLWYSCFVLSFLFFHMNFEGSAFGYFWPESPDLNKVMMPLAFAITQFFFCLFLPSLLNLKELSPAALRLYRAYIPVTLLFGLLSLIAPYQLSVSLQNLVNALVALYSLMLGIRLWRLGYAPARMFTIAWIPFIIGTVVGNMSSLGLLPGNTLSLHGYQIGSVIDVLLLSLALGSRIRLLQQERDRSQQHLQRSQQEAIDHLKNYEDLYQNSLSGRFRLDGKGMITGGNPALARMLGFASVDDLVKQNVHFDQFIKHPQTALQLWETLDRQQKVQGLRVSMMPRRGDRLEGLLTMRREFTAPDRHWVGAITDISEAHRKEQELKQLQTHRDQSMRQLVMGISHEMNTPLGNIRLAGTHLESQISALSPAEIKDQFAAGLTHINQNTERLADLNELIQSSLIDNSERTPEAIQMKYWLRDWKIRAQETFGQVDIEVYSTPEHAGWYGYPEALDKVLMQLLDNTLFHNPEKVSQLSVRVVAHCADRRLSIRYQDNGKGISKPDQERVFLPFYTTQRTKAKKKGLGLYEVHNLVTGQMQGSIEWPGLSEGFAITLHLPDIHPEDAEKYTSEPD